MTFAVVGIHGHFSKTLLLLFTPQIINFVLSIPQLFKLMPCPRHRLPGIDEATRLMKPSTFECKANEWRWLKVRPDDVECPNCTIICAILRICGPMKERQLTTTLLTIQIITSVVVFYIRYILFGTSK
jgi:UDP-N-acetylglucosamine--dolichyl-phosphate N-acetylglucosaminephosphotransferase